MKVHHSAGLGERIVRWSLHKDHHLLMDNPYVQNVSKPRFNRFKQKASSYIKIKDDH